MTFPRPWTFTEFANLLDTPGVILCGGDHAFALGRAAADEAELLTLATDPAHRRQGHGRGALKAFEAEAARRGAGRAFLEVARSNAPAIALYQAESFSLAGTRPGYYRAPDGASIDALILTKTLRPT